MDKPLISRLLLENSNQALPATLAKVLPPNESTNNSSFQWSTPKGSKELRSQVEIMTRFGHNDLLTRRLLFRKAKKGIDEKNFALQQAERRIQELEAKLEQLKPRKRRKVETSLNSRFADAKAIRQAQILAEDQEIGTGDSDLAGDSDSTEDCIEVSAL
jgi:hypothetical protein